MIAGSGPNDRDGNHPPNILGYHTMMISDSLTNDGYAVLRFDKRWSGRSYVDIKYAD